MSKREDYLPAPLNAVDAPSGGGREAWPGGRDRLVLARLRWRGRIEMRPARALERTMGAVLVEWETRSGSTRQTWLARVDVAPAAFARSRGRSSAWPLEPIKGRSGDR